MLVTLKGFGGIWEKRLRNNPAVPDVATRAVYYNTTGVLVTGKLRYRWRIGGKIRFFQYDYKSRDEPGHLHDFLSLVEDEVDTPSGSTFRIRRESKTLCDDFSGAFPGYRPSAPAARRIPV